MTNTDQLLRLTSGDTARLEVVVTDDLGSPKDISGASIRWALTDRRGTSTILEKTVGDGITITAPDAGEFEVLVDPADTADLSGRYRHEAEVTDAYGNVSTVLSGTATITADAIQ